jgi:hypothetical protein
MLKISKIQMENNIENHISVTFLGNNYELK